MRQQLENRLKENPQADISGYKRYYLQHIWDERNFMMEGKTGNTNEKKCLKQA